LKDTSPGSLGLATLSFRKERIRNVPEFGAANWGQVNFLTLSFLKEREASPSEPGEVFRNHRTL